MQQYIVYMILQCLQAVRGNLLAANITILVRITLRPRSGALYRVSFMKQGNKWLQWCRPENMKCTVTRSATNLYTI